LLRRLEHWLHRMLGGKDQPAQQPAGSDSPADTPPG
jgi:hypothetical protein